MIDFNKPTSTKAKFDGIQLRWDFENGYSGSVLKNQFTYGNYEGLWELAILKNNEICYDTVITDRVIGHLNEKQVVEILERIKNLKVKE